jgi:hypothetical protein
MTSLAFGALAILANVALAQPASSEYMFHLYTQADHSQTLYLFDKDGKPLGPVKDGSGNLAWALQDPNNQGTFATDSRLVSCDVAKNADGSFTIKSFSASYAKLNGDGTTGPAKEGDFTGVKLHSNGEDTTTIFSLKSGGSINDGAYSLTFGRKADKPLDIPAGSAVPSLGTKPDDGPKAPAAPAAGDDKYMFHVYNQNKVANGQPVTPTLFLFDKDGNPLGPVKDPSGNLAWAFSDPNNGGTNAADTQLVTAKVEKNGDGSYTLESFQGTYSKLDDKGGAGPAQSGDFTGVKLTSNGEDTATLFKLASGGSLSDGNYNFSFGEKAAKPLKIAADAPLPLMPRAADADRGPRDATGINKVLDRAKDAGKDPADDR